MKKLLYISILIFSSSSLINAQGTATASMRISATIVSGITLHHDNAIDISLDEGVQSSSSFVFTVPENLDSQIKVSDRVVIRNEFGDELEVSSKSEHYVKDGKRHHVNLKTMIESPSAGKLQGHYRGNLTTTINYL